jgi:hypothetical protein
MTNSDILTKLDPPISALSDADVLALADSKMDATQNERLGFLQIKGKSEGLTEAEQVELMALIHTLSNRATPQVRSISRSCQASVAEATEPMIHSS